MHVSLLRGDNCPAVSFDLAECLTLMTLSKQSSHHASSIPHLNNSISKAASPTQGAWRRGLSNFEEAFDMFTQVLKLKPSDPDVYFGIGICLEDLKEYDRAIIYFNKILQMDEDNIHAHTHKANCLFFKGEYEKAIECYDDVVNLDSNNFDGHFNKALSFEKLNRYKEAIECYDKVIQLQPDDIEAIEGRNSLLLLLENQ